MKRLTHAERLLGLTTVVGILHHIDHVLRVDHSGWPFIATVSPFTLSLLVYPIIISLFLLHSKPWYRFWAILIIFLAVQAGHTFLEPPTHLYHTWTYGSNLPWAIGQTNLLGILSPTIGMISVTISILLSIALMVTTITFWKEAQKKK